MAQEQEPHPARVNFNNEKALKENQESQRTESQPSARLPEDQLAPSTMTHSIKDRYVIRSQHGQIGQIKFWPTHLSTARDDIKTEIVHSLGDTLIANEDRIKEEGKQTSYMLKESAVQHSSVFRATSPVTQDQL